MLVVIYIRVSTDEQVSNFSLGFQEEECRKYAERNGWQVVNIFREEGVSAKTVQGRPQLLELIKFCQNKKNNVTKVLVYKFDRWSRNVAEGLGVKTLLARDGVQVISVTEPTENNAMGKAVAGMMLVMAELENNVKSERTIDGMKSAFNNGHWPWKAPIGFEHRIVNNKKSIVLISGFKGILSKLFQEASTGLYTRTELAERLNNNGYEKLFGSSASAKSVDKILKKKFYFGVMEAPNWKLESKGSHEVVIDEETWWKANNAIYKTPLRKTDLNTNEEFPLRRFIKCGTCYMPLTGSFSKGRKERYPYYHCARKSCSKPTRIPRGDTQEGFIEFLNKFQLSDLQQKLLSAVLLKKLEGKVQESENAVEKKREEIDKIRDERRATVRAEDRGLIDPSEAMKILSELRAKEAILDVELADCKINQYGSEEIINFTVSYLSNTGKLWEQLDLARKRKLQSKIFPQGVYISDGEFGTAELSHSFKLIQAFSQSKDRLVTPREFESRLVE